MASIACSPSHSACVLSFTARSRLSSSPEAAVCLNFSGSEIWGYSPSSSATEERDNDGCCSDNFYRRKGNRRGSIVTLVYYALHGLTEANLRNQSSLSHSQIHLKLQRSFMYHCRDVPGRRKVSVAVAATGELPAGKPIVAAQESGKILSQSSKDSAPRELLAQVRKRREFDRLRREKESEFEVTEGGTAVPFWRKRRNAAELEARQLTRIIVGLGKMRQLDQIFEVLVSAKENGSKINLITMNAVLAACVNCGQVDKALQVFNGMIAPGGVGADGITYGTLLKGLGQDKRLDDAFELLESMETGRAPGKPQLTEVHLNMLINACAEAGDALRARGILSRYRKFGQGARPSTFTYNLLIKGYARSDNPLEALKVMEEMRLLGLPLQRLSYNSLILASVRGRDLETALDLLEEMKSEARRLKTSELLPDVVTYTTLLKGLAEDGDLEGVHSLVEEMKRSETCTIDRVAYTAVIDACIQAGGAEDGMRFMTEMEEKSKVEPQLRPRAHVFLALMRALAERGDLSRTKDLAARLLTHASGQVWQEDRLEADELVMEAAVNCGHLKVAKKTLSALVKAQNGHPSFTPRGNKVGQFKDALIPRAFIRLMAVENFSLAAFQPVPFLAHVSPRSLVEAVMVPIAADRVGRLDQTVADVARLFLHVDILPILDNRHQCVGVVYASNCKRLEERLGDIMQPLPPSIPCNALVSQATDILISRRVEILSVVEAKQRGSFHGPLKDSFAEDDEALAVVGFLGVEQILDFGSSSNPAHRKLFPFPVGGAES